MHSLVDCAAEKPRNIEEVGQAGIAAARYCIIACQPQNPSVWWHRVLQVPVADPRVYAQQYKAQLVLTGFLVHPVDVYSVPVLLEWDSKWDSKLEPQPAPAILVLNPLELL